MQENISAAQVEKLNEAITSAMMEPVPDLSIRKLISYYGTNTACDRVYVFEFRKDNLADNTYEWCDQGVEPQIRYLQNVPMSQIAGDWMVSFESGEAVVIRDIETYRKTNPDSYEVLSKQGINRLICVPMRVDGRLIGFIGIDNPALSEMGEDELTFQLLGSFTAALIRHRDNDSNLHFLNERDGLTGLNNFYTFRQRVKKILETETRDSYIVYLNVSNFKNFNAQYGLEEGDKTLVHIAGLIQEVFGTDVACRSVSDHYFVFYQGTDVMGRVEELHRKCLGLRKHFKVWMRAGICRTHVANATYVDCDAAKLACDQLPDDNVSFCNVYSPEIMQSLQQEKYIQDNIGNAISGGKILVYFQPVVRAVSGKLCSFEALARWDDPKYGFLSPGVFIPVLEKHHQCYKIDTWVVEECCRMLAERLASGEPCVPVSFNISRTDFLMCDPVKIVKENADRYGIDHRYLCVEITESAVMESPEEIREAIRKFKEAGFQVWMDDFGSAYSSLNTLKDYEFDEIKLDMAFMRNLNENSRTIITSVVQMAKRIGIHTLCEGVETVEQLHFLQDVGCEKIQGYYYGKPMPLPEQLVNLSEKRIDPESEAEADLMDAVGRLRLDYESKFVLVFVRGDETRAIFASYPLRKVMTGTEGNAEEINISELLADPRWNLGQNMRRMAVETGRNGKETRSVVPASWATYFFSCRQVVNSDAGCVVLIEATDITEQTRDSKYAYYLRCVAEAYEEIYRYDVSSGKLEVIKSVLKGEAVGAYVPVDDSPLIENIHPKDLGRFHRFFDIRNREKAEKLLDRGSYTGVYRVKDRSGVYQWKAFTYIDIAEGDEVVYLLCVKPSAVADYYGTAEMSGQEQIPYGIGEE